jgi:transcriptional regulator with XRE-family HTH domain
MNDSEAVTAMLRDLGRQLAALRREAGLTQTSLAAQIAFSRPSISVAEIGRQTYAREFWIALDKALVTGGLLTAGFDQIQAARTAEQRGAARAAQEAREARALATFATAQSHEGVPTGVTALQPCPQCGCQVAVLTTLVSQPAPHPAKGNSGSSFPAVARSHVAPDIRPPRVCEKEYR